MRPPLKLNDMVCHWPARSVCACHLFSLLAFSHSAYRASGFTCDILYRYAVCRHCVAPSVYRYQIVHMKDTIILRPPKIEEITLLPDLLFEMAREHLPKTISNRRSFSGTVPVRSGRASFCFEVDHRVFWLFMAFDARHRMVF